ncbi:gluconate 2-dehydrogenase subunit 3 family protein [Jiulongibacter sp. NS-SX5]|uniref:gluconate 2-dehydrogenase subunit 3 family protein n=1 Tax=Jiulongibacter sp. NS-SX5 TaxID=3463854 RepID=UPI0040581472
MNRRNLIKTLGLGLTGAMALPAWANNWTTEALPKGNALNKADAEVLADLVDTLIPKTDTPGAKELGVDNFVKAMADTMLSPEDRQNFYTQLSKVDDFAHEQYAFSFNQLSEGGRVDCLKAMEMAENPEMKKFFQTLKGYTIQGYTSSEWYMTEKAGYQYAPGYGHGCVDA